MNKKLLVSTIFVLVVAAGAAVFWFTSQDQDNRLTLYGNVDIRQVALAFTQSERVLTVEVEEGDRVAEGDIIATLDDTLLTLRLNQNQAQIAAQQAVVTKLESGARKQEIDRAEAHVARQKAQEAIAASHLQRLINVDRDTQGRGVSQQDIEDARHNLASLRAGLAEAEAGLSLTEEGPRQEDIEQAKAQLHMLQAERAVLEEQQARSTLMAPSAGVVRARLLEPGDLASAQRPVITLALTSPKWVRVYVSESNLATLHTGDSAQVHADGYLDGPISGKVSYISSVAEFTPKNVQTETLRTALVYEVRVRVDDANDTLKLGMPVTVTLAD